MVGYVYADLARGHRNRYCTTLPRAACDIGAAAVKLAVDLLKRGEVDFQKHVGWRSTSGHCCGPRTGRAGNGEKVRPLGTVLWRFTKGKHQRIETATVIDC